MTTNTEITCYCGPGYVCPEHPLTMTAEQKKRTEDHRRFHTYTCRDAAEWCDFCNGRKLA